MPNDDIKWRELNFRTIPAPTPYEYLKGILEGAAFELTYQEAVHLVHLVIVRARKP